MLVCRVVLNLALASAAYLDTPSAALAVTCPAGLNVQGIATVTDGDTVKLPAMRIRLRGVAAPELDEEGGPEARAFVERLADGQRLACTLDGRKTRNWCVAICRLPDGRDIGAEVIAAALARDCPRYSQGRYADLEPKAAAVLPFPSYCRVK
jgi:endonuclease YncB( thermonuclease family)